MSANCVGPVASACTSLSCPAPVTPAASAPRARARVAGGILALTVAIASVTTSGAAVAATPTTVASTDAVRIALARTPAAVAPGDNLDLVVRFTGSTANLILRVSVHSAVTSRTRFADTIAGGDPGEVLDDVSIPVAFLPRTPTGNTEVPIGLQDPNQQREPSRLSVHGTGVYPMTISLSPPDADPVASVETWLVVAELVAANSGLGHRIMTAERFFETDTIFVGILTIGVLGLVMDQAMKFLGRRFFHWSEKRR